ncbi:MAG: hypothetical protein IKM73_02050 [Acidaminococcaceae bacterium]|nr:hypothetical protein [Acidaminococcaceae bacterium]
MKGLLSMKKPYTPFSDEEIRILEANPNTLRVTPHTLSLTLSAKHRIWELVDTGLSRRQIMEELGYDSQMLGEHRFQSIVRSVIKEANSPLGLHEGYFRNIGKITDNEEIRQLDHTPASYIKLKNEVIYLREEVEFLKKISQQVISGKRGK